MQENLFGQGLELMVFGMGTVFVFLVLLVGATRLLSLLVEKLDLVDAAPEPDRAMAPALDQRRLVAVIGAAIQQHRRHRR